jgi:hypothetical protein
MDVLVEFGFKVHGGMESECAVEPHADVKGFDPFKNCRPRGSAGGEMPPVNEFASQGAPKAFHGGVVITVAPSAHAAGRLRLAPGFADWFGWRTGRPGRSETCIVRSLLMASKLKFAIGPRLASYISHYSKNASLAEFQRIQKTHYGFVELDGVDLRFCFDAIKSQLRCSQKAAVYLPQRQLKFEGASPERERKSEGKVKTWISKISEIAFVHTKYVRQP